MTPALDYWEGSKYLVHVDLVLSAAIFVSPSQVDAGGGGDTEGSHARTDRYEEETYRGSGGNYNVIVPLCVTSPSHPVLSVIWGKRREGNKTTKGRPSNIWRGLRWAKTKS